MRSNNYRSDWTEVKNHLISQFSKLSDEGIETVKGNIESLSTKIQSVYGLAKAKADAEYKSFKESLHEPTQSTPGPPKPKPSPSANTAARPGSTPSSSVKGPPKRRMRRNHH